MHPKIVENVLHHLEQFKASSFENQDDFCTHLSKLLEVDFDKVRNVARLIFLAGPQLDYLEHHIIPNSAGYKYLGSHSSPPKSNKEVKTPTQLECLYYKSLSTRAYRSYVPDLISPQGLWVLINGR